MPQQLLDAHVQTFTEKIIGPEEAKALERATSYTVADAMREGSKVTGQMVGGWYDHDSACAWSAVHIAAKARGWL